MAKLGSYIKGLRESRGMSTYKAGVAADCSPTVFSLLERGKRGVSIPMLWRIVSALDGDMRHAMILLALDAGVLEEAIRDKDPHAAHNSGREAHSAAPVRVGDG
jgi:transcriptional regulator with XRE-family HTH domain